jgi:hypothetical protein
MQVACDYVPRRVCARFMAQQERRQPHLLVDLHLQLGMR